MASEFIIEGIRELERMSGNYSRARHMIHDLLFKACEKWAGNMRKTSGSKYLSKRSRTTLGSDFGNLRSSIQSGVHERGNDMIMYLGSGMPYARAWEEGRPSGRQPPSKPLADWVRRVLGKSDKESKSIGYLIARDIGRKGRKARPFLRPAIDDNFPDFKEDIFTIVTGTVKKGFENG